MPFQTPIMLLQQLQLKRHLTQQENHFSLAQLGEVLSQ
jgi:hypothetical protein